MKLLLACLILTFAVFKFAFKNSESSLEMASKAPSASLALREGNYSLVNGTTGCPTSVIWIEQCGGFVLNPRQGSEELTTEKFCHVNNGLRVHSEGKKKSFTQVELSERYVRRSVTTVQYGLNTLLEDTLIFDENKAQFLWEHSQNHKGFSCLYAK